MGMKLPRMALMGSVVMGTVLPLGAQEFGAAVGGQLEDAGGKAVLEAQESAPPPSNPTKLASQQLNEWLQQKNWTRGWDAEKERFIQISFAGANLEPGDMADFLAIRESLYVEAELMGKAAIIEAFLTKASASNLMSVPGNPVARQLEEEQRRIREARRLHDEHLEKARQQAAMLMEALDKAQAEELRGVTTEDRLKSLLDAAIKRLDASYSTEAVDSEKKKRVQDLKLRLQRANESLELAEEKAKKARETARKLQGEVARQTRSEIETLAEMPLFGAVTLAQAESYDDLRGTYQVAVVMAWSPQLEMEARSILLNQSALDSRPNRKTFNEWLNDRDLRVMVGTRRYLAQDGSINYIGISAAEYDPDDMYSLNDASMEAELWAKQYAILSLAGDVESFRRAERLKQDIRTEDGKTRSRALKNLTVELRNAVKGLQVSGLSIVRTEQTVHPPSGKPIVVAVASVNSDLARNAPDLMKETYATLVEVNQNQAYRQGQIRGMRGMASASRNDPAAVQAGYADGSMGVADAYNARNQPSPEPSQNQAETIPDPADSHQPAGETRSGTFMDDSGVEDDF